MGIFFTSDLHFGHDREFIYTPRGFPNIQEHDARIIENWNKTVSPKDEVYILGDLMLKDNEHGLECLRQLNGYKRIIFGNHDTDARITAYKTLPDSQILGFAERIKINGYHFFLSHYPTMTANLSDDIHGLKVSMLNLFGHTHQTKNFCNDIPMMYHVGVDSHDCTPVPIEQIITDIYAKAQECLNML